MTKTTQPTAQQLKAASQAIQQAKNLLIINLPDSLSRSIAEKCLDTANLSLISQFVELGYGDESDWIFLGTGIE